MPTASRVMSFLARRLAFFPAVLVSISLTQCTEEVRSPAAGEEQFVLFWRDNDRNLEVDWLLPEKGKYARTHFLSKPAGKLIRFPLIDLQGRPVDLCGPFSGEDSPGERWRVRSADKSAIAALCEDVPIMRVSLVGLSPDGKKAIVFDDSNCSWAIHDGSGTRSLPTGHLAFGTVAWSPDATQVAYYFNGLHDCGDEPGVFKQGLAVLTIDGNLKELVPMSQAIETPWLFAKYSPPAWDPSGRFIYYTNGISSDPSIPAGRKVIEHVYSPSAVYRIDLQTGSSEFITEGALCGLLTKENSLLLWPVPKQGADGKWTTFAAKFGLADKKLTLLPDKIRFPRLSPSGRLVACTSGSQSAIYRTDDWSLVGRPTTSGCDGEVWYLHTRWIVPEESTAESSPAPSSTTAPAGT